MLWNLNVSEKKKSFWIQRYRARGSMVPVMEPILILYCSVLLHVHIRMCFNDDVLMKISNTIAPLSLFT